MKSLQDFVLEKEQEKRDEVFVVYMGDGTMTNYFDSEDDAKAEVEKLNKESEDNKATYKKEPKSNIEK